MKIWWELAEKYPKAMGKFTKIYNKMNGIPQDEKKKKKNKKKLNPYPDHPDIFDPEALKEQLDAYDKMEKDL